MKLVLITHPSFFPEEAAIINSLFDAGLDILHFRKPNSNKSQCEQLLTKIDKQWYDRIVVHDYFCLKDKYQLKGIHLNRRNPDIPNNYTGHISHSCHSIEEVGIWKNRCDYVFLSPIFNSISKKGYMSNFSEQDIIHAQQKGIIDDRTIALGGIDIHNISQIKSYGFGGAAIMGGLWNLFKEDMPKDTHTATNYLKKLYAAVD
ncbi:MAG: thiamine phosphate synthase [Prevotellaceae bacterium]|nr:thiamine phosphate synthase [Prevotellaceae bacterium]